ncbi:MAG: ATP-grasp domain-containing protein [archaeon]
MKRKKIIITGVGGGIEEGLKFIKLNGFDLFIISERDLRIDANDEQLFISLDEIDKIKFYLKKHRKKDEFAGVIPFGFEKGVKLSAHISKMYRFPGLSIKQAELFTNKYLMYTLLSSKQIPVPRTMKVDSFEDFKSKTKHFEYPFVIKPVDCAGARGVRKVRNEGELLESYSHARTVSNNIIIQEFLKGSEHSIEAIVSNNQIYITGFSDRIYLYKKYNPFFVEQGDVLPTNLSQEKYKNLCKLFVSAINILKIKNGVVKGDLIYTCDGPKIIEMAGRLGSPNFWKLNNMAYGTNSIVAAIYVALGKVPRKKDVFISKSIGVTFKCIFFKNGFYKDIKYKSNISKMPGFVEFRWWKGSEPKQNTYLGDFKNLSDMVAFVITKGNSRKESNINCDNIIKKIKIRTI